jgi:hypothetical protein
MLLSQILKGNPLLPMLGGFNVLKDAVNSTTLTQQLKLQQLISLLLRNFQCSRKQQLRGMDVFPSEYSV